MKLFNRSLILPIFTLALLVTGGNELFAQKRRRGGQSVNPNATSTGNIGFFGNRTTDLEDYWKIKVTEDGFLRVRIQGDSLDLRGDGAYFQLDAEM